MTTIKHALFKLDPDTSGMISSELVKYHNKLPNAKKDNKLIPVFEKDPFKYRQNLISSKYTDKEWDTLGAEPRKYSTKFSRIRHQQKLFDTPHHSMNERNIPHGRYDWTLQPGAYPGHVGDDRIWDNQMGVFRYPVSMPYRYKSTDDRPSRTRPVHISADRVVERRRNANKKTLDGPSGILLLKDKDYNEQRLLKSLGYLDGKYIGKGGKFTKKRKSKKKRSKKSKFKKRKSKKRMNY